MERDKTEVIKNINFHSAHCAVEMCLRLNALAFFIFCCVHTHTASARTHTAYIPLNESKIDYQPECASAARGQIEGGHYEHHSSKQTKQLSLFCSAHNSVLVPFALRADRNIPISRTVPQQCCLSCTPPPSMPKRNCAGAEEKMNLKSNYKAMKMVLTTAAAAAVAAVKF